MYPILSSPQRIVLLIDLHPLLRKPNPNYLAQIRASIHKILTFPPLSSCLFAFKLFISSLSPILSTSKLHHLLGRSPPPLSFRRPFQTLAFLHQTLYSLDLAGPTDPSPPRASFLAKFLLQLEHDYSWELDSTSWKGNPQTLTFPSNLVLLFSPVYRDCLGLESLDFDGFLREFCRIFCPVNDKFVSRDIHFSWVGVDFDGELKLGFFESGFRELGWGFCTTDAIVVGSALVPFGLIFPYVGCKMGFTSDSSIKKGRAELVLGITDVSGKPLECKSCNLEVISLELAKEKPVFWALFSKRFDRDFIKVRINEVWRRDEGTELADSSVGIVLLHGISGEHRKEEDSKTDFIVDRVLKLLCKEKGELMVEKPIWQILLAFLFRRNYWASVSISDSDGNSLEGILKPFTVNYALLSIVEKYSSISCQLASKGSCKPYDITVADASNSKDGRRKRNKVRRNQIEDVTWSSFYEVVFKQDDEYAPQMDLEEVYFETENSKSKKLRFLKCWMGQMKKSNECCQIKPNELMVAPSVIEEEKERLEGSQQELDLHASFSPMQETLHNVPINQEVSSFASSENIEAFLRNIPQKIEHGMCSKEVDLWNLAKRLVVWSIDALYAKSGSNRSNESFCKDLEGASDMNVPYEVSCLLLVKPKDLTSKYKSSNSESFTSDQYPVNHSTETIIREHELQILFRMELLQSVVAGFLEENVKQKMVKEICSLLQNIEFYLQGDFLCGESLLEFAGRTIKSRYAHSLGDVIHKIYNEMEFFSFDDELGASGSFLGSNSEEPNRDDNENVNSPKDAVEPTASASSRQLNIHLHENDAKDQQYVAGNARDQKLMKAQKQRDRARRFSSFTSWVPDLHRVWALKRPRMQKEYFPKSMSKRLKRERNEKEIVQETPMTAKQHSHMQEDKSRGLETARIDDNSWRWLSKALFLHEGEYSST